MTTSTAQALSSPSSSPLAPQMPSDGLAPLSSPPSQPAEQTFSSSSSVMKPPNATNSKPGKLTMNPDLPRGQAVLPDVVKQRFQEDITQVIKPLVLILYKHSVIRAVNQRLRQIRTELLGVEKMKELISRCLTPEEVGIFAIGTQEVVERLLNADLSADIRDLALGNAMMMTATQVKMAAEHTLGHRPQLIKAALEHYQAQPLPRIWSPKLDVIDYGPLHSWIEDEKEYGCLIDDLSWEHAGSKSKHRWDYRLNKALEAAEGVFEEAITSVNFSATTAINGNLLGAVPPGFLYDLIIEIIADPGQVKVLSGPLPVVGHPRGGKVDNQLVTNDVESLARLGFHLREKMLKHLRDLADSGQTHNDAVQAEQALHGLLDSGLLTATNLIDWGKALATLKRYDAAQKAFSLALKTIAGEAGLPSSEALQAPSFEAKRFEKLLIKLAGGSPDAEPDVKLSTLGDFEKASLLSPEKNLSPTRKLKAAAAEREAAAARRGARAAQMHQEIAALMARGKAQQAHAMDIRDRLDGKNGHAVSPSTPAKPGGQDSKEAAEEAETGSKEAIEKVETSDSATEASDPPAPQSDKDAPAESPAVEKHSRYYDLQAVERLLALAKRDFEAILRLRRDDVNAVAALLELQHLTDGPEEAGK